MDQTEPQKPKPTKDGKQIEGPAYSTRSKTKRTYSHSVDESTGSQAHSPPPKRRTRRGAKQAKANKSVGINNEDSAPVDLRTVDEYTSAEIALRNDLVLETLFRYINWSDLLRFRVVNKQWQYEATKELRRRKLVIRFLSESQGNQASREIAFQDVCRRLSECRTPSLLSSFQVEVDDRNDLGSAGVGSIFTAVGNNLKHLTLHLNYKSKYFFSGKSFWMTHLRNLLFRQAPNLEFLEIKFDFPRLGDDVVLLLDSSDSDYFQNGNNELRLLPNLKTLIIRGTPPPMFLAEVINAAVNLRSVEGAWAPLSMIKYVFTRREHITSLRRLSSAFINYFLGAEGRVKIHLLKSFRVYLVEASYVPWDGVDIELIEMFLTEHMKNLQLETFECVLKLFYKHKYPDLPFAQRSVSIINQILECSSGSLKKLRIELAKWFKDVIIIPRLPKLQEICFDCHRSSGSELDGGGFFPPGFNMNHSFPNISTIVLLRCAVSLFRLCVSSMEVEMTEPVPSIRRIILIDAEMDSDVLPRETDFHRVFPNLLSVSYVNKGKYYKI